jgi:hypothetical protein
MFKNVLIYNNRQERAKDSRFCACATGRQGMQPKIFLGCDNKAKSITVSLYTMYR